MRKADPDIARKLLGEIRRSAESRYDHRLHGVLLVARGLSCGNVGRLLGTCRRTVQYWVHRFEVLGLPGLRDGDRSGRPRSLDGEQVRLLAAVLDLPPGHFGLDGKGWSGKMLRAYLEREFGVTLSVRQCQRLLREIKVSP